MAPSEWETLDGSPARRRLPSSGRTAAPAAGIECSSDMACIRGGHRPGIAVAACCSSSEERTTHRGSTCCSCAGAGIAAGDGSGTGAHAGDDSDAGAVDIPSCIAAASVEVRPPCCRRSRPCCRQNLEFPSVCSSAQPADGGYSTCRLGVSYCFGYRPELRLPHLHALPRGSAMPSFTASGDSSEAVGECAALP